MDRYMKWAGIVMALAGLLMLTRMVPIFATLPDDMAFPPKAPMDIIRLAEVAGLRWQLSHAMGLSAMLLFTMGYWLHAKILANVGSRRVGAAAAVTATIAFGLFAIALVIDGFQLPAAINAYTSGEGRPVVSLEDIISTHELALSFFTPGIFLMFAAIVVLSSRMLHRRIHSRWLGVVGQVIAFAAITAFLFGSTGPNWDNLRVGGLAIMAAFLWHLLVGLRAMLTSNGPGRNQAIAR